jgi:hypothetical protein
MGGLSLAQTGALLGHKSLQTTLRYVDHLNTRIQPENGEFYCRGIIRNGMFRIGIATKAKIFLSG